MPVLKLGRLRRDSAVRDWSSRTTLLSRDLIMPYFVVSGKNIKSPIKSMPGINHLSIDRLVKDISETRERGIKAILLFGIPEAKDRSGSGAYKKEGIVQRAVKAVKKNFKDIIAITDVCLCGYTSHGHCCIIREDPRPETRDPKYSIDYRNTLKVLAKIALSHADAGADLVAPSAMMDGQVGAIRDALDRKGFKEAGILAYSAKYASNLYLPFREVMGSSPQFGDRKAYQMDYRDSDEALREIGQDIDEGADVVMVKPALSYLDIIYRAKEKFNIPLAAYNVSGEYSMIKRYIEIAEGKVQRKEMERSTVLEILTGIKRAGADFIISYYAKEAAKWLKV